MTWTVVIIVIFAMLKMLTSPPSAVVGWFVNNFALHPKLESKDITVTFNGKYLKKDEKSRFIKYFNEALFLKRYNIFQGNEELFLNPETNVIPFVINVNSGKKEMKFYVYSYDDHVDVVKQWKKKVASYSLSSEYLQKITVSNSLSV